MAATPPPLPKRFSAPSPARAKAQPLDMQLLQDLPNLELKAQYMMEGYLSGRHRSPQKGSSIEFAEYRNYQTGDDLRRVDWRLYGRTNRLHVRQYEEETQLRVFLLLDTSASMIFRSRRDVMEKLEYSRLLIAALGLAAQRQRDAFGLAFAGEGFFDILEARSSLSHWKRLIGRLETLSQGGRVYLCERIQSLAELIPPRSLVIIASDFYEPLGQLDSALRKLRFNHHDIIGLHVLDPQEIEFDLDTRGTFVDLESGVNLQLDAAAVRKNYLKRFGTFCDDLDHLFHDVGGDLVRLRTDLPPISALARYLAHRAHRL